MELEVQLEASKSDIDVGTWESGDALNPEYLHGVWLRKPNGEIEIDWFTDAPENYEEIEQLVETKIYEYYD